MIKILLDTNMLIYREDHSVVSNNVLELTKILYDSNRYRIVIHPMTFDDVNNIKNKEEKKIIYSKLQIYNIIDKPPQATKDFNLLVGCSKIPRQLYGKIRFPGTLYHLLPAAYFIPVHILRMR